MKIAFASHTPIGSAFVVGSHHLAREFARLGHQVAHVSMPITLAHAAKAGDPVVRFRAGNCLHGGERTADGVFNYVPFALVPWPVARRAMGYGNLLTVCIPSIGTVLRREGFDSVDVLLVDAPKFVGIERLLHPRLLVYRATDLYSELTGDPSVGDAEEVLAQKADILLGTSQPVLERLEQLSPGKPALLLVNGVDAARFGAPSAEPKDLERVPHPRAVYVGALDGRFDVGLVEELAERHASVHIVLIGPESSLVTPRLSTRSNVHCFGVRPYESLPGYLQHCDVALLPMTDHPANRGRSPMKLFEYGSAGLPVVATESDELRRRELPFVTVAPTRDAYIGQVAGLLSNAEQRRLVSGMAMRSASQHSWPAIAAQLLKVIQEGLNPSRTSSGAR